MYSDSTKVIFLFAFCSTENQVFVYFLISAADKAAFPPEPPMPSVAPPIPSVAPPIPMVPRPPGFVHKATGFLVGGGKVWHSLSDPPRFLSLELRIKLGG
jgi:hypothetical protein